METIVTADRPEKTQSLSAPAVPSVLGVLLAAGILAVVGCSDRQLMPTPNLYVLAETNPFADVPAPWQTNTVDVLYVTDRQPIEQDDGAIRYGHGRSTSAAIGSCVVEIGEGITWDELVRESRTHHRSISLPLKVRSIEEWGRSYPLPHPLIRDGDKIVIAPEVAAHNDKLLALLNEKLRDRLAVTPRKEAFIFVHGFNNSFDDAAIVMAEMWHFLGREGVPIAYTWPAGAGAMLRGYTEDYESSRFTVYHFKQFLRILARCPDLERVNILAHSRGTGVVTTGLRELVSEDLAASLDPHKSLKIGDVVLAAPDLDAGMVSMQLGAERTRMGIDRMTVLVSTHDKAIGLSQWLFGGRTRTGRMRPEDLPDVQTANLELTPWVCFVDARISTRGLGHSYYRLHPGASSDVILTLRYGRDPGADNGRPLTNVVPSYWYLTDDYPQ